MEWSKSCLLVGHFIESKARQTTQAVALRARIVLACGDGQDNKVVAARQCITPQMVSKCRARFVYLRSARRLTLFGRHRLRSFHRAGWPGLGMVAL